MMNATNDIRQARPRTAGPRRGVAMLLVLISLGTATILTMAYVASRDNSIEIGANVADSATARWSALSGLELGVSVLETETNWRTSHTNGVLLNDHPVGAALVDLLVEDIETNAPPTETTNDVRLTSIATVGGVTQTASATASVSGGEDGGIDVDLSEFAVFVGVDAVIDDDATITRWPKAPASAMGHRVAIGTQATSAGAVAFNKNAAAIDATVYHGPGASDSLVLNASSPMIQTEGLLSSIPMPAAPPFPLPNPEEIKTEMVSLDVKTSTVVTADTAAERIVVATSEGVLTFRGDVSVAVANDLELKSDSGILIDGNVTLVVYGRVRMDNASYIELLPGATLQMYLNDEMVLDDAYIGDQRADRSVRDVSGTNPYMNPQRVQIFGATNAINWGLRDQSVIKGSLYGPRNTVNIKDDSAVYGRVAARRLNVVNQGAIFYDHALDSGSGYTNPDSAVFNEDGTIKADVASLGSLSDASLQTLADALAMPIKSLFGILHNPNGGGGGGSVAVGPNDPTPRTVAVELDYKLHGYDKQTWEDQADGAIVLTVETVGANRGKPTTKNPGAIVVVN